MTQKTTRDGTLDDLAHGQVVLVTARWILVATALLLTLWNPSLIGQLRLQVVVMLMLAFANFYLNLELFKRRRTLEGLVYGASAADLAVITLYVLSQGIFKSPAYIFYFPALLALSVAFPTALTLVYAGSAIGFYGLVALANLASTADGEIATADLQALVARLLMLAAVAFCGNLYRRIETNRRRAATQAEDELMARVRERSTLKPA